MRRTTLTYSALLAASVAIVVGLLAWAPVLLPDAATPAARPVAEAETVVQQLAATARQPLARLLLQLIVIVLAARVFGALARRIGQPAVVGEIAAGIVLGPSILGAVAPEAAATLFPPGSLPMLQTLSQIGVLLFMFVVGVELDVAHLRGRTQAAVAVSHFSIALPFILGVAMSFGLYRDYARDGVSFTAFALFMGIAMSITAFPVLARILEERGLAQTPIGATALTCAAVDDVTAWSLLALVVAISTAVGGTGLLLTMLALSIGFVLVMLLVVQPLLARVFAKAHEGTSISKEQLAVVLIVLVGSAWMTEVIGIHALFGAFLAGTIMPRDAEFRRALRARLEPVSSVFLLPIFFAFTGLRTQIGLLDDVPSWLVCLGIVMVATVGKVGGTLAAARWTGLNWHEAWALGALMNTRGLMELVALNVGYELGILSPAIFAIMVLMALVTTAMTGPFLIWNDAWHRRRVSAQEATG